MFPTFDKHLQRARSPNHRARSPFAQPISLLQTGRDQTMTWVAHAKRINLEYGLQISSGIYGSNSFEGNGQNQVLNVFSAVSQNNNNCNGTAC